MAMVSSEYDTSTPNKENPSVSSVGEMENLGSEGSRTRSDAENSEKVIDQKTVVRRRMTERERSIGFSATLSIRTRPSILRQSTYLICAS